MANHDTLITIVVPFGSPHFSTQAPLIEGEATNFDAMMFSILGVMLRRLLQHRTSIFSMLYAQICVTVLLEDLEECGTEGCPYE